MFSACAKNWVPGAIISKPSAGSVTGSKWIPHEKDASFSVDHILAFLFFTDPALQFSVHRHSQCYQYAAAVRRGLLLVDRGPVFSDKPRGSGADRVEVQQAFAQDHSESLSHRQ